MKRIIYNNDTKIQVKKMIEERENKNYSDYEKTVNQILEQVKLKGDEAVLGYTAQFDKVTLNISDLKVSEAEIDNAYKLVDESLIEVIRQAKQRILAYHSKQKKYGWFDTEANGSIMGQHVTPIEIVGLYVPGGKAFYPSSVLMNALPALVAGVERIVMVTPPLSDGTINPLALVAAKECGITEIYKVGGAQAIGALAYGTDSIPKVYKIVGPGNIYVTLAKKAVFGYVSIDSIAGPSEVLVIADKTANPVYIAADLMSQAEHDEMAACILVTPDEALIEAVELEISRQVQYLSRKEIILKSIENNGQAILVKDLMEACEISNFIAPEHLEIDIKNPFELLPYIKNAGAIFLGEYTPEPLGDYIAGPNHVLPTNGTAKFFSPLSVDDFIKKSSVLSFSKDGFMKLADSTIVFAEAEQLTAHANAIRVRK